MADELTELREENARLKRYLVLSTQAAGILMNTVNKFEANIRLGGVDNIYLSYPDKPDVYFKFPYGAQWIVHRHDKAQDLLNGIDMDYVQTLYDELKNNQ